MFMSSSPWATLWFIGMLGLINFAQGEIEVREGLFFDKMTVPREFLQKLTHKLAQGIGVQPRVKLVEPGSLNRQAETSPRVIDLRQ
jgi:phenylacetate-CoA ligase